MQLDKTHIKIRQRTNLEVADLAMLVARHYAGSLLVALALGALPWMFVNLCLIGWIPWRASALELDAEDRAGQLIRYLWLMTVLVYLQAPLGCAVITGWLGRAVFEQRPTMREVMRDLTSVAWRLVWSLGLWRGPIPIMLLLILIYGTEFEPGIELGWILTLGLLFVGLRTLRPFVPEILILERCPLRRKKSSTEIIARERSRVLHSPLAGEVMARSMFGIFITIGGALSLTYGFTFVRDLLVNRTTWQLDVVWILIPVAFWLVAGAMAVLRFLNYLDLRIRLEGWEVDLALRAEAARCNEKDGPLPSVSQRLKDEKVGGLA